MCGTGCCAGFRKGQTGVSLAGRYLKAHGNCRCKWNSLNSGMGNWVSIQIKSLSSIKGMGISVVKGSVNVSGIQSIQEWTSGHHCNLEVYHVKGHGEQCR